jgi:hypothetical protein
VRNVTLLTCPDSPGLRQDAVMADRYRAPGGWCVEVIHLAATSGNRDGEWLRVSYRGLWVADVRTPAELERWFPLASLEQQTLAPAA